MITARRVYRYQQADSTNRIAKTLLAERVAAGSVVAAEVQSGGKGQYDREFCSPAGGLYFSLVLRPLLPLALLPMVTLATGVACCAVLTEKSGQKVLLKWPNDLMVQGKKLAGILCETVHATTTEGELPWVVIGVGINVNSNAEDFPPDLRATVTTLFEASQARYCLTALLEELLLAIEAKIAHLGEAPEAVLDDWRRYDYLVDKPVRYLSGERTIIGTGKGLADDGRYIICDRQGIVYNILGGQLRPLD